MSESADSPLAQRLEALDAAREIASRYFLQEEIEQLDVAREKVRGRLRHGTEHTVVAIAGATGSGKSSIVNRLAGEELTAASVRRPTTAATHAAVFGGADAGPLLDWLDISRRYSVSGAPAASGHDGSDETLDGLVLLDLPDHDSTAVEHRIEVDRLVELVDVLVWVTDPQKYADAALHLGYIQPLANHAAMLRFVLNQVDRLDDGGANVAADFARLLGEDGIDKADVHAVSAATGAGFNELTAMLTKAIQERTAVVSRLDADLVEATEIILRDGSLNDPTGRPRDELIEGLAEAAGSVEAAEVAVLHHVREGRLVMGWPFTRFIRRLARKPLADLPGPGRSGAGEPRTDLALRDYAEEVSANSLRPWPGAIRGAANEQRDELIDDLRRSVGREVTKAGSHPRWWIAVAWLQRLCSACAVVGLGWLLVVAALGGLLKFETEPLLIDTPGVDWMPLPSALLLGGIVLGLLTGWIIRIPLGIGAKRRGRAARRAIEKQVGDHASKRVVQPVQAVVADHVELQRLLVKP